MRLWAAVARTKVLASAAAAALTAWSTLAAPARAQVPAEDRALRSEAAPSPPAAARGLPAASAASSPLPAGKSQGTRLVDTDANLSIDRPGPGWEWSALSLSAPEVRNAYAVTNQHLMRRFLVFVFESKLNALRPSVLEALRKSLPNGGTGVTFFASALPPLVVSVVASNWQRKRRERKQQAAAASDPSTPPEG